jgi:hypothetical protein
MSALGVAMETCYDCLETLGEPHVKLQCAHTYHEACLRTWLAAHPHGVCPICDPADVAPVATGSPCEVEPETPSLWGRLVSLLFAVAQVGGVRDTRHEPPQPSSDSGDWRERLAALYADWGAPAGDEGDEVDGEVHASGDGKQ